MYKTLHKKQGSVTVQLRFARSSVTFCAKRDISKVKEYIKENYKEASLEDAAVQVSLSPSYLSRIFKEKCGMGFSDYLTKTRMEKACELLGDIQYKSYDIAYYIGYDNPKNFSRAFKAYFGMTPKEYRNGKVLEKG